MAHRTETYCNGRLIKRIDRVRQRSLNSLFSPLVDGTTAWLLDGRPVREEEALVFQEKWESGEAV